MYTGLEIGREGCKIYRCNTRRRARTAELDWYKIQRPRAVEHAVIHNECRGYTTAAVIIMTYKVILRITYRRFPYGKKRSNIEFTLSIWVFFFRKRSQVTEGSFRTFRNDNYVITQRR